MEASIQACMAFERTESPQHRGMIRDWLQYVSTNSNWCKAYMFMLSGYTFMAVSTGESTRQNHDNVFQNFIGSPVLIPSWSRFQVYRYVGLSVLNFHGVSDSRYQGTLLPVSLGDFIREQYRERDLPYMQGPILGGHDADSLRAHFGALGIRVWVEITTGNSYLAFRGLDAYVKAPC